MRKIIIAISACIMLLLAGFAGYRGYQVWKQNHLLSLAKMFSDQRDPRNEALCLQQVLSINPRNVEACRRLAILSEAERSPAALIWRERVVALAPDALEDRLALAQCALVFKELDVAANALAAVDDAGKKSAAYQNLAGIVAITLKQPAEAEAHFVEASRLEPWNQVPQLNLAVIHLRSTNPLDTAEARINLKRLSQNPTNANIRVQATRELVSDSIRRKDLNTAAALSADLVGQTNASFNDKLVHLNILKDTKNASYAATLAKYQGEAATNTANLTDMTAWLISRTSPKATLSWLQGLSPDIQTNSPGVMLMAECQTLLKSWPQLQHSLEKQDWREMDFLRHAYLSRALREQNLTGAAAAEWELAIKFANPQKIMQISLFKIAATWGWSNEAEQILWTIVNRYPEEKWADQALQQALISGGRTRPLMQLLSLEAKRQPDNLATMNDLAMIAMLLDAKEISPFEISRKVYEQAPKNASFASTYAFSLYLQKQSAEALAVMQKLRPEDLNQPSNAGYYGLILKANGDMEKAQTYLNWSLSKGRLLPEERQIFQQALKK